MYFIFSKILMHPIVKSMISGEAVTKFLARIIVNNIESFSINYEAPIVQ